MYKVYKVLDDVLETTTSKALNISGARRISFWFKRSAHGSGKTVFTVNVSINGTDYVAYNKLIDNTANAIAEGLTRVASYDTGTANAEKTYSMSTEDCYKYLTVTATETTDGTHAAWVCIDYGDSIGI